MSPVYETFPLETSPTELALDAHAWLADRWPDYSPSPANFDSGTVDVHARMVAELRDVAASVPDAIFLRLAQIFGITPVAATPATVTATVTASDTLGYVLRAGTNFGLRATGDEFYTFANDVDVTIPAGASVSGVFTLTATEGGAGPNGLGGVAVPMSLADRTLPWLTSAQTASVAAGGTEAETETEFLDGLVTVFRLNRPTPMNAEDVEAFVKRDPAIARAYAIDRYLAGTDEVQSLGPHDSTGGTFTITWSGQTTAAVQWNASAAAVQAALEALSNVAVGDVVVTGGPLPAAVFVRFTGLLAEANQPAMTTTAAGLTGGTDTVSVTTTTAGVAPVTDADAAVAVWVIDVQGLDPGESVRARQQAALMDSREAGFVFAVKAPAYDDVGVEYAGDCYPGWDAAEVQGRVDAAIAEWLSPATAGIPGPSFGESPNGAPWYQDPVIRLTELVQAINDVDGFWRLTGPGANGLPYINGAAADYTLTAPAPAIQPVVLPTAGTIVGAVSPA